MLSVSIVAKNEEKTIGRCIESVKSIADEIIVVDSGSEDKTVEIAKNSGAKVIFREWTYYDVEELADEDYKRGLKLCFFRLIFNTFRIFAKCTVIRLFIKFITEKRLFCELVKEA